MISADCPICHQTFKDPVSTPCCGQSFCNGCMSKWLSAKSTCPWDRKPLRKRQLRRNVALRKTMAQVACPCPHDECDWRGTLDSLRQHLDAECQYEETVCPHCKRLELRDHDCPQRPIECAKCGATYAIRDRDRPLRCLCDSEGCAYDGHGAMRYPSGTTYEGQWRGGRWHGRGREVRGTETYEGEFVEGQRHGCGSMDQNGDTYKGQWMGGEMQGEGEMRRGDLVYTGQWSLGEMHGTGTLVNSSNRHKYTGQWHRGFKQGHGVQEGEGWRYEGQWHGSRREGCGTETSQDYSYDGEWHKGNRHGRGTAAFGSETYTGQWKAGTMHGKGKHTFADGSVYEGEWLEGARTGYGVLEWCSGMRHSGEWVNGMRHGCGTLSRPDGSDVTGVWRDDAFAASG